MGGNKDDMFIRCFAETEYGELEFDHTFEQVPEDQRKNIKIGSIISGVCILSGDVAIDEYENGAIKDYDHDLRLLRYVFEKGEAERLRSVLAKSAVYESERSGKTSVGPESIIEWLDCVHKEATDKCSAFFATITESKDTEFTPGTRCIVLAYGEESNYESIAFITVNEDGMIEKITISTGAGYRFNIDIPAIVSTPLDDLVIPESVIEPIVLRARFHGLIDNSMSPEDVAANISDYYTFENNAQRMLDALREESPADIESALRNAFGYLFAKSIEQTINMGKMDPEPKFKLAASYCPSEAIDGELTSTFTGEDLEKLVKAMELGKQFYNDFRFFAQGTDLKEESVISLFKQAAVIVQRIGQLAAESIING